MVATASGSAAASTFSATCACIHLDVAPQHLFGIQKKKVLAGLHSPVMQRCIGCRHVHFVTVKHAMAWSTTSGCCIAISSEVLFHTSKRVLLFTMLQPIGSLFPVCTSKWNVLAALLTIMQRNTPNPSSKRGVTRAYYSSIMRLKAVISVFRLRCTPVSLLNTLTSALMLSTCSSVLHSVSTALRSARTLSSVSTAFCSDWMSAAAPAAASVRWSRLFISPPSRSSCKKNAVHAAGVKRSAFNRSCWCHTFMCTAHRTCFWQNHCTLWPCCTWFA